MKTHQDLMVSNVLVPSPALRVTGCPRGRAGSASVLAGVRSMTRHPRVMVYRRLMLGVVMINLAVLVHHLRRGDWPIDDGSALSALSALVLANLAVPC